jgi:hypothetical protein
VSKDFASGKPRLRAKSQIKILTSKTNKKEMKTLTENLFVKTRFTALMVVAMAAAATLLGSCSKDDDAKPDTRAQFIGTYAVEDVSSDGEDTYEYDVTISQGTDGMLNISNFADIFNVPVKASVDGNKLIINQQSFTNPSSGNTLKVYGQGTLTGSVLKFTYTTEGYLDYTGTCTANKKQ